MNILCKLKEIKNQSVVFRCNFCGCCFSTFCDVVVTVHRQRKNLIKLVYIIFKPMKNLTYNRRAAITFHSLFRYIHSKGKKKLSRF